MKAIASFFTNLLLAVILVPVLMLGSWFAVEELGRVLDSKCDGYDSYAVCLIESVD